MNQQYTDYDNESPRAGSRKSTKNKANDFGDVQVTIQSVDEYEKDLVKFADTAVKPKRSRWQKIESTKNTNTSVKEKRNTGKIGYTDEALAELNLVSAIEYDNVLQ